MIQVLNLLERPDSIWLICEEGERNSLIRLDLRFNRMSHQVAKFILHDVVSAIEMTSLVKGESVASWLKQEYFILCDKTEASRMMRYCLLDLTMMRGADLYVGKCIALLSSFLWLLFHHIKTLGTSFSLFQVIYCSVIRYILSSLFSFLVHSFEFIMKSRTSLIVASVLIMCIIAASCQADSSSQLNRSKSPQGRAYGFRAALCQRICETRPEKGGVYCRCDLYPMINSSY